MQIDSTLFKFILDPVDFEQIWVYLSGQEPGQVEVDDEVSVATKVEQHHSLLQVQNRQRPLLHKVKPGKEKQAPQSSVLLIKREVFSHWPSGKNVLYFSMLINIPK